MQMLSINFIRLSDTFYTTVPPPQIYRYIIKFVYVCKHVRFYIEKGRTDLTQIWHIYALKPSGDMEIIEKSKHREMPRDLV